ncbi:hypothetical protein BP1258A_5152 [Burkholderia pseudomallei 1258a]|uniref:Uncharacterized protein n=1 Tax=Burkholderia pseudomallei (strain 1026b) TaxID=884204 RepID=A0A0H3HNB0_BURP2|nr:hypothetical protein BP1026B_I2905 [Burkholderia pseudomallei 1026b]EIF52380.1 hypothetical protein BP1258B_6052 [Burkholderia pseudomallei 1258b]EIF54240.1 hypothetical protein BP1258A_5152 [Burkholderia pseudomallei 1258a]EIF56091.1 hypothetical protein BP1026A_4381 [Burkholderia pseudomallei 1026a]
MVIARRERRVRVRGGEAAGVRMRRSVRWARRVRMSRAPRESPRNRRVPGQPPGNRRADACVRRAKKERPEGRFQTRRYSFGRKETSNCVRSSVAKRRMRIQRVSCKALFWVAACRAPASVQRPPEAARERAPSRRPVPARRGRNRLLSDVERAA